MLYVVATPIGNLEDITLRALRILREVDLIACEDTRRTGILLNHYHIEKPLVSYHQHSKLQKIDLIIEKLKSGQNIALVTDAGTPGISDPGGRLIEEALKHKIEVEPIPGPTSFSTILSAAGFYLDKFIYLGFLPKKKGRATLLKKIAQLEYPIVICESPYRIIKTLEELQNLMNDPEVVVGRELTKKFAKIYRGKISEVIEKVRPQGEFVIVIKHANN